MSFLHLHRSLYLEGNLLQTQGTMKLAKLMLNHQSLPNLSELNLKACQITDEGMKALAEGLLVKKNIRKLDLRCSVVSTSHSYTFDDDNSYLLQQELMWPRWSSCSAPVSFIQLCHQGASLIKYLPHRWECYLPLERHSHTLQSHGEAVWTHRLPQEGLKSSVL